MMEGSVETPFGQVKKQTAVIIGGGLVLILGIAWYRSKKQKQDASAASAGANTGIDPATGYPFGSAEDAAALASQGNYINPGGGGGGGGSGGSAYNNVATPGPGTFTSNAQWAQYVENYMLQSGNVTDASGLAAAIGRYLAGLPATADQQNLIHQAIAFGGLPPQSGPSGYPPSINTAPAAGDSGGSTGIPVAPTNIRQTGATSHSLSFAWDKVPNATDYQYWETSDFGGSFPRTTTGQTATWDGLMGGVEHTLYVKARNSQGESPPAIIHMWTLKQ